MVYGLAFYKRIVLAESQGFQRAELALYGATVLRGALRVSFGHETSLDAQCAPT